MRSGNTVLLVYPCLHTGRGAVHCRFTCTRVHRPRVPGIGREATSGLEPPADVVVGALHGAGARVERQDALEKARYDDHALVLFVGRT